MQPKTLYSLISASVLSLAAGGAFAAGDEAYSDEAQAGQEAVQAEQQAAGDLEQQLSSQYTASSLQGLDVQDSDGQQLGSIQEIYIDKDGKVSHVAVTESGALLGLGDAKSYLVPWDQISIHDQDQVASVDVSQDQLGSEFSAFEELPSTTLDQPQDEFGLESMPPQPDAQEVPGMESPESEGQQNGMQ